MPGKIRFPQNNFAVTSSYFIYGGDKSSSVGSGVIKEEHCTLIMLYTSSAVWMEFFSEILNLSRVAAYMQSSAMQMTGEITALLILHINFTCATVYSCSCVCVCCVCGPE